MSAGSEDLEVTPEQRQNAWKEMEAALDGEWTEDSVLAVINERNEKEYQDFNLDMKTKSWMEQYGMDESTAEEYAKAYMALREEVPEMERDEFKEMVEGWYDDTWDDVSDKTHL